MSIKPLIYNRRNADEARQLLMTLKSPNRLPISAIENAVTSVNGQIGDVVIPLGEMGDFQPKSEILTHLSSMNTSSPGMIWQENGDFTVSPVSSFIRSIMSSPNEAFLRGMLSLGNASTLDTNVPNGIPTLGEDGKIPSSMLPSVVGFSGSYNDLSDKPELFSGNYEDLENKPVIPEVNYPVSSVNSKTGHVILTASDVNAAPVQHGHTIAAVAGLQTALDSKISTGSTIPYSSLSGAPSIPSPQLQSDWNQTDINSLDFIKNKPVISYPVSSVNGKSGNVTLTNTDVGAAASIHGHSISQIQDLQLTLDSKLAKTDSIAYSSLTGLPVIPPAQIQSDWQQTDSTSKDFIKNKPTIPVVNYPVVSVNGKLGAVSLTNTDVGAAATVHGHAISDISGLQTALDSKLTSSSIIPYTSISGVPTIPINNSFSFLGLNDTDNTVVNSGYLKWNSTGTSVQYDSTIPYTAISGAPVIPTNTSQLTNGAGFITASQAASSSPVQSVNGKTGLVTLTASDVGAAASGSIPGNNSFSFKGLNDTDDAAVNNGFLRWNSTGTSVSYSTTIPYSVLTGTPVLATVATSGLYTDLLNRPTLFSGSYTDLTNKPVLFDGTWSSLTGKPSFATVATSGSYVDLSNKPTIPTIPTNISSFTNDSGYLTSVPVQSVNTKTGAIVLSASDVGAAPTAQGTKYYRQAGTQVTGVKVKYYSVTSDANGAWTLNLGTDFTELLDVQAQAVSTTGITGVRQSTVNAFSSNSTTISGMTWGNTVLVTILVSGTNSLSLTPNTVVRVRVEGVGP